MHFLDIGVGTGGARGAMAPPLFVPWGYKMAAFLPESYVLD